ncbi:MAG: hypothetical protein AUG49_17040 [Catenulispora sp. 13_1_20CM_3_70_7]|nr:MAG: hypothetical protein AUG49_17040 [Catenulispora sp. 13_1_20CM_3_70_7]
MSALSVLAPLAADGTTPTDYEQLSFFGRDVWWLILIKVVAVFAFLVVTVLMAILFERKIVGYMQQRIGPNRTGPWGMLQSLADGVKLMLKEDIIPTAADKIVFFVAPLISTIPAFLAIAVVPFGPADNEVSIFGHRTPLQLTDLPVGILYVLAATSIGIYGIVLAGWASGSTYPLLGGLRSTAQMISYEIAMSLSFVAVFIYAGTMSTSGIVNSQHSWWNALPLLPSFLIYLVSMVGETNRAPFDLPEAEGELVGGFHTEYSSIKFALFFLAEYVNMVTVSSLAVTMFLGGWHAPFGVVSVWAGANSGWWPVLWYVLKLVLFMLAFFWLRATLPRLRYDQFMKLGWKVLIPASLVWLLAVSVVRTMKNARPTPRRRPSRPPRRPRPSTRWPAASRCRRCRGRRCRRTRRAVRARPWSVRWSRPGSPSDQKQETPMAEQENPYSGKEKPTNPLAGVAGFGVTFSTMFKKRTTEQYPEEPKQTALRFHGRHQLNRHPDGLEKCVGCELCAWACPADAIYVEGADNTDEERYSPGERYGRVYQINYLRCILCGLCIEACPTRALTMTNEFELADSSRASLIYTKEELLAGLSEGMVETPHSIFPGMTAKDYYEGKVTAAAPGTVRQPRASQAKADGGEDSEREEAS